MKKPKYYAVLCPVCGKEASWVENKEKYGRNYGKSYMCYFCKDCDTYVGCHQNTRQPLGTMADPELRKLRMAVHSKIDPFWRSGKYSRKTVYRTLSDELGYQFHTGESTKETCQQVLDLWIEKLLWGKEIADGRT